MVTNLFLEINEITSKHSNLLHFFVSIRGRLKQPTVPYFLLMLYADAMT